MAEADEAPEREDDEAELAEVRKAFARAEDAWSENYDEALEDFRFARLDDQWPEKIRKSREEEGRPCLTINRLAPLIRQVVNDGRQNKPAISVHPVDSFSDPETAEVFNGLIRHIEQASDADIAYDTALDHSATGGFGWIKVNTVYANDDGFEQDIVIETVPNAFSIIPDPDSISLDGSDWTQCFELVSLTKEAFEAEYPDADVVSFDGKGYGEQEPVGDTVQVLHHWTRQAITREIVALSPPRMDAPQEAQALVAELIGDSMVIDLAVYEENRDLFDLAGVQIVGQPRRVPSWQVKQTIWSGAGKLREVPWAGKFIPIVPVYGEDINLEGKRYLRGLVRSARDPQRMFNYWRSTTTELVALAPKAPFVGPVGAFETDRAKWESANTQSHAYLEYDAYDADGRPVGAAPQRQPFGGVPAGALQEALNASDDIKAITGLYDASVGARSNETSGRAIMARQREGDVSTFHYIDNLSRAIRQVGRIVLDLIPKTYNTPRIIRILGPDGSSESVPVNQEFTRETRLENGEIGQIVRIYKLDVGKYDLTVTAGPSFTSRREEAATQMIELIRAYPQVAPLIGDLLAKNLDWPGADEIAERLKAMLPAQLQGESPQAQAMQAEMQKLAEMLGQSRAELQALKADKSIDARKVEIDAYEAETNRLEAIVPKGAPFDPAQMAPVVAMSLVQILQSPDVLALAQQGAPPEVIMQALAGGARPPPQPPAAAPGMGR